MEKEKILLYDGSFNGFLTCIFTAFEQKINVVGIQRKSQVQKGLFTETQTILTQVNKAKRVWNGIS
ncbi:MAG: DNA metabolism protein, partial [Eudoraea sp.]